MPSHDLKRLARHHIELSWNKGRMALVEQLHSKDFLYKSSFIGRPLDTAGYIRLLQDIRTAMPDLEVVVEHLGDPALGLQIGETLDLRRRTVDQHQIVTGGPDGARGVMSQQAGGSEYGVFHMSSRA